MGVVLVRLEIYRPIAYLGVYSSSVSPEDRAIEPTIPGTVSK
jgi:hypothetical protein